MTQNARVAAGARWADQISLGVLASSVPRDVIDDVVASHGRQAKRSDGKLPPHVMVYFAMAMALFAGGDYEAVGARLAGGVGSWGCWDARSGVDGEMGVSAGKGSGEKSLAGKLYGRLEQDWLLIADRNFYNWQDWTTAAASGAALLWRVKADLTLPVLQILPDGSYLSVLVNPRIGGKARQALIDAARAGEQLDAGKAALVRVIEYQVPGRGGDDTGELIALITTITDPRAAPAPLLAQAYHQRWEHETGNDQLKTHLRGPGQVLRSKSPAIVRQEIYRHLVAHHAISARISRAAPAAAPDPTRVQFTR